VEISATIATTTNIPIKNMLEGPVAAAEQRLSRTVGSNTVDVHFI
jgi:hypothetical protein